jgi:hypothetical protein
MSKQPTSTASITTQKTKTAKDRHTIQEKHGQTPNAPSLNQTQDLGMYIIKVPMMAKAVPGDQSFQ